MSKSGVKCGVKSGDLAKFVKKTQIIIFLPQINMCGRKIIFKKRNTDYDFPFDWGAFVCTNTWKMKCYEALPTFGDPRFTGRFCEQCSLACKNVKVL